MNQKNIPTITVVVNGEERELAVLSSEIVLDKVIECIDPKYFDSEKECHAEALGERLQDLFKYEIVKEDADVKHFKMVATLLLPKASR